MDFFKVIENRHSVRKFADKPVERELLEAIVSTASTAPSSRNSKSTALMIIEDQDTISALSEMRDSGSAFMKGAKAVIVVTGDESKTDLWVDNCAISATFIQLAATALKLGSCWVHINGRPRRKDAPDGETAEDYVKELLGIRDGFRAYCAVAIGYPLESEV
ncbi:MAG: nitroreductase family protein [Candidatus Cryptobacteroides sp.]